MQELDPPKSEPGCSILSVFTDLPPKLKQTLDRRKIYSYHDIINSKNEHVIKQLNVPIEDLIEKYNHAESKFQDIWNKDFGNNQKLPALQQYSKIIKCLVAGKQGELIEVSGDKSSGKTCVILEIAAQYLKQNPLKSVSIINGSSGITKLRYSKLPFDRVSYIDVYNMPALLSALEQPLEHRVGMVIIDGFLRMIKSIQKPRQQLKAMMEKFLQKSDKIKYVFQNSTVADKNILENDKPIFNNMSEYAWIISNLCENRVSTHKISDTDYLLFLGKSKYGCLQNYQKFRITDYGYEEINF